MKKITGGRNGSGAKLANIFSKELSGKKEKRLIGIPKLEDANDAVFFCKLLLLFLIQLYVNLMEFNKNIIFFNLF